VTDIEKVIEGFEMSYRYSNVDENNTLVPQQLVLDALALLKAQEPVEPKIVDTFNLKLYHNDMFKNHYCGNCGEFLHTVNRKDLFCSQCGRAVKWE
jgi:hypothetical protein